jgi:hypothetical protein
MRGFLIESKKRKTVEWYPIKYERLPYFCFSCGKIGHSNFFCPTPTERDENGKCPYDGSLHYQEPWKQEPQWQQPVTKDTNKASYQSNGNTNPSTSHVQNVVSNFNFKALGGGQGGSAQVYKRRETPKASLDITFPVIKGPNEVIMIEEDPEGSKRNALVNSPSKIAGVSVPAKRAKGTGEEEEHQSDSDSLVEAENQPHQDQ